MVNRWSRARGHDASGRTARWGRPGPGPRTASSAWTRGPAGRSRHGHRSGAGTTTHRPATGRRWPGPDSRVRPRGPARDGPTTPAAGGPAGQDRVALLEQPSHRHRVDEPARVQVLGPVGLPVLDQLQVIGPQMGTEDERLDRLQVQHRVVATGIVPQGHQRLLPAVPLEELLDADRGQQGGQAGSIGPVAQDPPRTGSCVVVASWSPLASAREVTSRRRPDPPLSWRRCQRGHRWSRSRCRSRHRRGRRGRRRYRRRAGTRSWSRRSPSGRRRR